MADKENDPSIDWEWEEPAPPNDPEPAGISWDWEEDEPEAEVQQGAPATQALQAVQDVQDDAPDGPGIDWEWEEAEAPPPAPRPAQALGAGEFRVPMAQPGGYGKYGHLLKKSYDPVEIPGLEVTAGHISALPPDLSEDAPTAFLEKP